MRICFPEKPQWPAKLRRGLWRRIPHPFKAQDGSRNRCGRCGQINYRQPMLPRNREVA